MKMEIETQEVTVRPDWEGTFWTCKFKNYARSGWNHIRRCMKNSDLFELKYCFFCKPNKKCPEWEAKEDD